MSHNVAHFISFTCNLQCIKVILEHHNYEDIFFITYHTQVVLRGSPNCQDSHDLSECHHLYDLGRNIEQTSLQAFLTQDRFCWTKMWTDAHIRMWTIAERWPNGSSHKIGSVHFPVRCKQILIERTLFFTFTQPVAWDPYRCMTEPCLLGSVFYQEQNIDALATIK